MQPTPPPVTGMPSQPQQDDLGMGLKIVSFCFPIVGIILYFVKKEKEPVASKQACTWAIGGIVVGVVINVIYYIIMALNH